MKIIGVDVGGTFTDIILQDLQSGRRCVHKVPSTPNSQDEAVIRGITELLERESIPVMDVDLVVHGTTVATNAMLERKGAKVSLVTTAGIEDVLEIGRQNRSDIYDICANRPLPLVDRENRIGIKERLDWKGEIITPLENSEINRVVKLLKSKNPESIAISFLFSFSNPKHEHQLVKTLNENLSAYTVCSFDVLPEFREFERTSTTVLEAYLGPLVLGYLDKLDQSISKTCPNSTLNIMQSNGGTILCSKIDGKAIGLAISGLAGGVIGGWDIARSNGISHALTLDMGGTSCDISAVIDGVVVRADNEVAGLPLRFPSVDVKTIGAGGGSIAWIDDANILHVGPQSAGADPGPASYDNGGKHATVTDANLILGRLNPEYFVGGEIQLKLDAARKAIQVIGNRLGKSLKSTALGIIRISSANMVQAIREVTVERGRDPRSFVLVPFGGAGPTQAVDIAESLNIKKILIPPNPGITSAYGLICADLRVDLVKSVILECRKENERELIEELKELTEEARKELTEQGAADDRITIKWQIDMRYQGQSHEMTINVDQGRKSIAEVSKQSFETSHETQFGYQLEDRAVEWVSLRVVASARQSNAFLEKTRLHEGFGPSTSRKVYTKSDEVIEVPIYRRVNVPYDTKIVGPLIIEQIDTTTWVDGGWCAEREKNDIIWLRRC